MKILGSSGAEPPSGFHRRPSRQHFTPTVVPDNYGPPPAIPSTSYGVPNQPASSYGVPNSYMPTQSAVYGPPSTPPPIIHKHIYVHVPPPEPEYTTTMQPFEPAPAQKHYRIIFIKAPDQPIPTIPPIPQPVENEEKTIVYVLVKKPEDVPEIIIPTPASTVPSKPEVYFIRYKTEETTLSTPDTEPGGYYRK